MRIIQIETSTPEILISFTVSDERAEALLAEFQTVPTEPGQLELVDLGEVDPISGNRPVALRYNSYTGGEGATSFEVEYRIEGGSWNVLGVIPKSETPQAFVYPPNVYQIRVVAVNSAGRTPGTERPATY